MLLRRIAYRVITEELQTVSGVTLGEDDCRDYIIKLNQRFRDNQLIHVELLEEFEQIAELTADTLLFSDE